MKKVILMLVILMGFGVSSYGRTVDNVSLRIIPHNNNNARTVTLINNNNFAVEVRYVIEYTTYNFNRERHETVRIRGTVRLKARETRERINLDYPRDNASNFQVLSMEVYKIY